MLKPIPPRFYASTRRAWTPRLWPVALPSSVFVFGTIVIVGMTMLESMAFGVGFGVIITKARWAIWKHRHPVITVDEYMAEIRRNARWN